MLRLRPSELTLTPADVEETRCRMIRQQQAPALPVIPSTASYSLHGPVLRRGPVRSRDDAIHHLGKIPVLTPHQVVHASSDAEGGLGELHRSDSAQEESDSDNTDVQSQPDSPSPTRTVQLPRRAAPTADFTQARLVARANADVEESPSAPKHSPVVAGFGRTRTTTSEDRSGATFQTPLQHSVDGSASDPRASTTSTATPRAHRAPQQPGPASPSQGQGQAVSSSLRQYARVQQVVGSPVSEARPTLFLQGYFVSPDWYTFSESYHMPHTEPRQRSGRLGPRGRTLSSTSDPSHSSELNPSRTRLTPSGDVFSTLEPAAPLVNGEDVATGVIEQPESILPDEERPRPSLEERIRTLHNRLQSTQGRMRNFFERRELHHQPNSEEVALIHPSRSDRFSEASSSSSQPYSYYELSASRHSSLDHAQTMNEPPAQYDGAGASRPVSRGAYFSIRPSQVHAFNEAAARPRLTRVASFSSPDLTAPAGQHLSPRPASPYARLDTETGTSRAASALLTEADLLGPNPDAANAVERDMASPLDLVAQRAYNQLAQAPSMMPLARPSTVAHAGPSNLGPRIGSVFQYHVESFDGDPHRRGSMGHGGMRQESGNAAHHRMLNLGRHADGIRTGEPFHQRRQRTSSHHSDAPAYVRGMRSGRAGQRSSENVPVGAMPSHASHSISRAQRVSIGTGVRPRTSQGVAMRGGGGGDLPHPMHHPSVRHQPSMRRLDREHDLSGRERFTSSSPVSPRRNQNPNHTQTHRHRSQRLAHGPGPLRIQRALTTSSSTFPSDTDGPHDVPVPRAVRFQAPPVAHEVPQRQLRISALAPEHRQMGPAAIAPYGMQNRRPPIPGRIVSRRITPQQRDQENSGDAEAELMREEMAAARMRYADDGVGLDVLDETPPRVGRFERRILEQ